MRLDAMSEALNWSGDDNNSRGKHCDARTDMHADVSDSDTMDTDTLSDCVSYLHTITHILHTLHYTPRLILTNNTHCD